jgi:hypothetical protein
MAGRSFAIVGHSHRLAAGLGTWVYYPFGKPF